MTVCVQIHGHSKTRKRKASPTYKAWGSMKERCQRVTHKSYADYGGRGISVCARWDRFENFLADMGVRPDGKSLGRKNNDGNYEPSNCEWQTDYQQRRNTRQSRLISFSGESLPLCVWAERLGLSQDTLTKRLDAMKWSVERSLTTPARKMKNSVCRWQNEIDAFKALPSRYA